MMQRKVLKGTHLPLTIKEIQQPTSLAHILKICICIQSKINYQAKGLTYGR